jgi:hypothetical protein
MTNNEIRQMIINILDDEQGINDSGFCDLYILAKSTGNEDVVKFAKAQDGRWFIGENDAEDLRLTNSSNPVE